MPFFIPVDYYDTACSSTTTSRYLRGNHAIKVGRRVQPSRLRRRPSVGFANGRFIFAPPTATSINYARTTSNGVRQRHRAPLPAAGGRGRHLGRGGRARRRSRRRSRPSSSRTSGSRSRNLTIHYGLRWEAHDNPTRSRRRARSSSPPSSARPATARSSRPTATIPDDYEMWQPRLGISWDPTRTARPSSARTAGSSTPVCPALNLASSRSTNGSLGQTIFRNSALTPILGPPPPIRTCSLPGGAGVPPRRLRLRQGLPEPAHHCHQRRRRARGDARRWPRSSSSTTRRPSTSPASSTATTRCSARPGRTRPRRRAAPTASAR